MRKISFNATPTAGRAPCKRVNKSPPGRVLVFGGYETVFKLLILILLSAASSLAQPKAWRQSVAERLPRLGEGNWIVVADSAFPLHSAPGFEMILSDESQLDTLRHLLNLLAKDARLRPILYTDAELRRVPEQDAPGMDAYRQLLPALLEKFFPQPAVKAVPHAGMMHTLEEAAKAFNVLIIKTNATLPYTSVFLELKPGYWTDDAEQRLRQSVP